MIVIPAVDLRDGRCVQLVGGSYDREMISLDDPVAAALRWQDEGFKLIHVVDLDAATGSGDNAELVRRILEVCDVPVQVGGGIRTTERLEELFDAGASRLIVGTRAFEDRDWLEEIANTYPARIIVAADVRDRSIVVRGWQTTRTSTFDSDVESLNDLPLAGILVTAVHREGQMKGPDVSIIREAAELSVFPVQASGGIGSRSDLLDLDEAGASAAVVGMALYTGALSAADIGGNNEN